jgi:hypothetical protein
MPGRTLKPPFSRRVLGRRQCLAALGVLSLTSLDDLGREAEARAEDSIPDFRVIVHFDNPLKSADRVFLARAFMKEVSQWGDGETIHPVDLRSDSKAREKFSEAVVRRSVSAVRSYWQQRIFAGLGLPPPELDSDDEVVRYVLKYRGSVGYVSGRADLGKAKAITVNYD